MCVAVLCRWLSGCSLRHSVQPHALQGKQGSHDPDWVVPDAAKPYCKSALESMGFSQSSTPRIQTCHCIQSAGHAEPQEKKQRAEPTLAFGCPSSFCRSLSCSATSCRSDVSAASTSMQSAPASSAEAYAAAVLGGWFAASPPCAHTYADCTCCRQTGALTSSKVECAAFA